MALMSLAVFASPAHALFGDDEARKAILELREQLQTQKEVQMQMYERLENLTQEVQTLRGELDDLNNSYKQPQDAALPAAEPDPAAKAAQEAQDRDIEARQALDAALKNVNKQSYDKAISSLTSFAQKYKGSKLVPEALYWLGSCYYAKGNFTRAIEIENRVVSNYSSHGKVPDALLILGMAQLDAKKTDAGKATLNRLVKQYPKSEAAKIAKSQL